MEDIVLRVGESLVSRGYRKKRAAFFRVDAGVYRLIDFQRGAHGGGYFFVNLGVHPLGLPRLRQSQLVIPDQPKEYECALRQRIDQIAPPDSLGSGRGFFRPDNEDAMRALETALEKDIEPWFREWSDFRRLASADEHELSPMLTVVPALKKKAFLMLRFFCLLQIGDRSEAAAVFRQYQEAPSGIELSRVDRYLQSLLAAPQEDGPTRR